MRTALLSSLAVVGLGVAAAGATTTAKAGDWSVGVGIGVPAPVIVAPDRFYPPRVVRHYGSPTYSYGPRYGHDRRWEERRREERRWHERRWRERNEGHERHHDWNHRY
jgi:hypothetical protein